MSIPAQGAVGAETMTIAAIIEERWTGLIGPAMEGGKIGWKRHELCREFANAVRTALTHPIAVGKLPLVALDFAEAAWGDVWVENEIDTLREFAALASPRADSDERTAGAVPDSLRALSEALAEAAAASQRAIETYNAKETQADKGAFFAARQKLHETDAAYRNAKDALADHCLTLLASHPAGQSAGSEAEEHGKCIGCGKALTAEEAEFLVNACDACEREDNGRRQKVGNPAPPASSGQGGR